MTPHYHYTAHGPHSTEKGCAATAIVRVSQHLIDEATQGGFDLDDYLYHEAVYMFNQLYSELDEPITITRDDITIDEQPTREQEPADPQLRPTPDPPAVF